MTAQKQPNGTQPISWKSLALVVSVLAGFHAVHTQIILPGVINDMRGVAREELEVHKASGPHPGVRDALEEIRHRLVRIEIALKIHSEDC